MNFYHLKKNIKTITGYRTRFLKTTFKNVIHIAGEFLGNKIADAVFMSNENKIVKQEPVEEIIVPPEERDEILNKSGQAISK